MEEIYYIFFYSVLFVDDGSIGGLLCVVIEDIEWVIGECCLNILWEFVVCIGELVWMVM